MSYTALGKSYTIETPYKNIRIKIPIEQITADARNAAVTAADQAAQGAAQSAINAAWPHVQQKLYGELPKVMDMAMDLAVKEAKPFLRAEVDRTLEKATSAAAMVATGLGVVIVGAAIWIRAGQKRR